MWYGYGREELDRVVADARPVLEKFNGKNYWDRPRETTGPLDPHPGHLWDCTIRLGRSFGATGAGVCNCAPQTRGTS